MSRRRHLICWALPIFCCPSLSLRPYYVRNTHDFRIACTYQRWPYKRYTCTINGQVLTSYYDHATHDLIASIGTSDQKKSTIIVINTRIWKIRQNLRTRPQTGQRPASLPLLAASCIELVTKPCEPSKCRSRPWSVKNRNWHFWQFNGGRL